METPGRVQPPSTAFRTKLISPALQATVTPSRDLRQQRPEPLGEQHVRHELVHVHDEGLCFTHSFLLGFGLNKGKLKEASNFLGGFKSGELKEASYFSE